MTKKVTSHMKYISYLIQNQIIVIREVTALDWCNFSHPYLIFIIFTLTFVTLVNYITQFLFT